MLRHPDIRIGLVLFAIFAALFGYTFTLPQPRLTVGVGPAFVPRLVLLVLLGLTLLLLVQAAFQARRRPPPPENERSPNRRHLYAMGLAIAFVLVMDYVGTFVGIPLFVIGAMLLAGGRRPVTIAAMAISIPAIIYFIFTEFLQIQFPAEWAF